MPPRTRRLVIVAVGGLVLANACRSIGSGVPSVISYPPDTSRVYDPPRDLGALFHDIQLARIFPDSKTLVDARPRVAPAELSARYERVRRGATFSLRAFVDSTFDLPPAVGGAIRSDTTRSMEEHIRTLWPALTRPADSSDPRSSLIPLTGSYVVPGGRFREVYYWDSYFTMLGLIQDGRTDLVNSPDLQRPRQPADGIFLRSERGFYCSVPHG